MQFRLLIQNHMSPAHSNIAITCDVSHIIEQCEQECQLENFMLNRRVNFSSHLICEIPVCGFPDGA